MKLKINDYKLVCVKWHDAGSNDQWVSLKSVLEDKDQSCLSVGWLVSETPQRLILVASRTDTEDGEEDVSGHVTIPGAMVESIIELKVVKPRKPKKELAPIDSA